MISYLKSSGVYMCVYVRSRSVLNTNYELSLIIICF
jgi:hypothetical protein